jgi:hypothetical protein
MLSQSLTEARRYLIYCAGCLSGITLRNVVYQMIGKPNNLKVFGAKVLNMIPKIGQFYLSLSGLDLIL